MCAISTNLPPPHPIISTFYSSGLSSPRPFAYVDQQICAKRVIEELSDIESLFMAVGYYYESLIRCCSSSIPVAALVRQRIMYQ